MVTNKCWLVAVWLLMALPVSGQVQDRYIVYFKDKAGTPYSVESPEQFLSARSLERRSAQGILTEVRDLPVNPDYIQAVRDITGDVYYPSKWLNAVLVQCSQDEISQVLGLSQVAGMEVAAAGIRLPEGGRLANKLETAESEVSASLTDLNDFQLAMHGIPELHADGHYGEGMMVAIMDGGFGGADTISALRHVFDEGRLLMSENIVTGSGTHFAFSHGTNVMSIMAGMVPGEYTGIVPDATFLLFGTEDPGSEQRVEEYNWVVAAEKADSAGVDVINTSLGYNEFDFSSMNYTYEDMDGNTTMITRGANWAAERGMLVVVSAGNAGSGSWKYINAPADAQNILAVGAVDNTFQPAPFSSYGPSFDGRIKPEVSSLGVQTVLIRADGSIGAGNGTSFAAPIIAGFASSLWQRFPEMTVTDLRQYIISISSRAGNPGEQVGYGIPSVSNEVTGTEDKTEKISVYPNPAAPGQAFHVRVNIPVTSMHLYALDGKKVAVQIDSYGNEYRIVNEQLRGMYLLRIETVAGTHILKIISN